MRWHHLHEMVRIKLGQGANPIPANNFLRDIAGVAEPHPFSSDRMVMHGNVVVHVSREGSGVHIHDILSSSPDRGHGNAAMKTITDLADKHGVKLHLHAKSYLDDPRYPDTNHLVRWYHKHGFRHDDETEYTNGSDMTRHPN